MLKVVLIFWGVVILNLTALFFITKRFFWIDSFNGKNLFGYIKKWFGS
ncbi:MAG: hypothetical protein NC177_01945 [Ruminococcus flavefaciens]|nr:hypothetical protein [Ruminococcus flavefaciens]